MLCFTSKEANWTEQKWVSTCHLCCSFSAQEYELRKKKGCSLFIKVIFTCHFFFSFCCQATFASTHTAYGGYTCVRWWLIPLITAAVTWTEVSGSDCTWLVCGCRFCVTWSLRSASCWLSNAAGGPRGDESAQCSNVTYAELKHKDIQTDIQDPSIKMRFLNVVEPVLSLKNLLK